MVVGWGRNTIFGSSRVGMNSANWADGHSGAGSASSLQALTSRNVKTSLVERLKKSLFILVDEKSLHHKMFCVHKRAL